MLQKTDGVYKVGKSGYHIVMSDLSNTRGTFKTEFYNAMVENSDMAYELAKEKFPGAIREAERFQLFQRLDYMLHIPVERMKNNPVCDGIIRFFRSHKKEIRENPYLSKKEKRNLKIRTEQACAWSDYENKKARKTGDLRRCRYAGE